MRVAAVLLAAQIAALPAAAAELTVTVRGVVSDAGRVRVAVCTAETFLGPDCPHRASAPAAPGTVAVTVAGLPPGTYAVQAFHDADDDGVLGRNLVGWPREGMGFSNDAPMRFGPPAFADAAVRVGEAPAGAALSLRYPD